jgi:glycerol-3-phosphate dehydrogenase (NAD(P)+)
MNDVQQTVAVIGGGSWATANVKILSEKNIKIKWWLRDEDAVKQIQTFGRNPKYLSDVKIDTDKVSVTTHLSETVAGADYLILMVPAAFIRQALHGLTSQDFAYKTIVSGIKGMIPEQNLLVTDWISRTFQIPEENICAIAGPCHAEEVALEKQSYLTIASKNIHTASDFAELMTCRYIKASATQDMYGVEFCAVMKNIIAIACGITHGLGYGDNFQAVLVSNAMQEIQHFVDTLFPYYRNMSGSAYLGDLLVTSYSQFSRNRMFGNMIGRGYSVKAAQMEMNMIAEGYYAVKSIHELNILYRMEMPIVSAVYKILYESLPARKEIQKLKELLK